MKTILPFFSPAESSGLKITAWGGYQGEGCAGTFSAHATGCGRSRPGPPLPLHA